VNERQLDQMPVHQLIEMKSRIEKLIQVRIKQEREALFLKEIRSYEWMIAKSLNGVPHANGGSGKKKSRAGATPRYRDPGTGATWTGRGPQPRWMREAIRAGKSPDDFLIPTEH